MGNGEPVWCPILRPTRQDFSRPFPDYVADAFKANPGAPMLRIIPPKGYTPRVEPFPELTELRISTPIKQHVFGTKGAYRCLLEEQRGLQVSDFKKLAYRDDHQPPRQGHREDALLERAFWSSITLSPPYYGADTPCSFFDEHLRFGWNLRDLKCLLTQQDIPAIPGVTTPMTYFGMWKSFFSWHIEDVDLYSINYLHFGAPKVWYSVSPADRAKFENMAQQLYPELARNCKAFLRHKDILISPRVLRAFNVPFQQARQESGEFIVLAAAAYHSGFNQGFNCAEAVNFALEDWVPLGRVATRCSCTALNDAVRLDMRMFKPEGEVWSEEETSSEEEEEDSGEEEATSGEASGSEADDSEAESDSAASSQTNASEGHASGHAARRASGAAAGTSSRGRAKAAATKPRARRGAAGASRPSAAAADDTGGVDMATLNAMIPGKMGRPFKSPENAAKAASKLVEKAAAAVAEAEEAMARKRPSKNQENEAKAKAQRHELLSGLQAKLRQAKRFQAAARAAAGLAGSNRAGSGSPAKPPAKRPRSPMDSGDQASPKRMGRPAVRSSLPSGRLRQPSTKAREAGIITGKRNAATGTRSMPTLPGAATAAASPAVVKSEPWGHHVRDGQPMVIVGQDTAGAKYFYMVQKVADTQVTSDGVVSLQWLAEGRDGLYRPTAGIYQEKVGALIGVRTQWLPTRGRREGGFKLLTQRSRILATELV